jgi:hypothetical protein
LRPVSLLQPYSFHLPPERVIIFIILRIDKYFGQNDIFGHRIWMIYHFVHWMQRDTGIGPQSGTIGRKLRKLPLLARFVKIDTREGKNPVSKVIRMRAQSPFRGYFFKKTFPEVSSGPVYYTTENKKR